MNLEHDLLLLMTRKGVLYSVLPLLPTHRRESAGPFGTAETQWCTLAGLVQGWPFGWIGLFLGAKECCCAWAGSSLCEGLCQGLRGSGIPSHLQHFLSLRILRSNGGGCKQ